MDVIRLLRSKNRCLNRLHQLCVDFLAAGDLDRLEPFQKERDAIFKAFELYDRMVSRAVRDLPLERRTRELVIQVQALLNEKDGLVQAIIARDNELMTRIEEARSALAGEIARAKKGCEIVGKFKSGWVSESGEGLDQKA